MLIPTKQTDEQTSEQAMKKNIPMVNPSKINPDYKITHRKKCLQFHSEYCQGQSVHYLLHGDGQFAFAIYYSDDPARDGEGVGKWERCYPLFAVSDL